MARLRPLWLQNAEYSAAVDRRLPGALWPQGGANGMLLSAVANTRTLRIGPGSCAVPRGDNSGSVLCVSTSDEDLAIDSEPNAGQNRYDQILVRARDSAVAGADDDFIFEALKGPVSGSPVPPTGSPPPDTYRLGYVYVAGGQAFITGANVTMARGRILEASGGGLIGYNRASPTAQAQYTVGAGNFDLGAFAVSFRGPPSGLVLFRWTGFIATIAGGTLRMQVYANPLALNVGFHVLQPTGNSWSGRVSFSDVIAATPGNIWTFTPHAWSDGQASYFYYGGSGPLSQVAGNAGPAISEVYAVPSEAAGSLGADFENISDVDLPIHLEPEFEQLPTEIEIVEE